MSAVGPGVEQLYRDLNALLTFLGCAPVAAYTLYLLGHLAIRWRWRRHVKKVLGDRAKGSIWWDM